MKKLFILFSLIILFFCFNMKVDALTIKGISDAEYYLDSDYAIVGGHAPTLYIKEMEGIADDELVTIMIDEEYFYLDLDVTAEWGYYDVTYRDLVNGIKLIPHTTSTWAKVVIVNGSINLPFKIYYQEEYDVYNTLYSIPEYMPGYYSGSFFEAFAKEKILERLDADLSNYDVTLSTTGGSYSNFDLWYVDVRLTSNNENYIHDFSRKIYFRPIVNDVDFSAIPRDIHVAAEKGVYLSGEGEFYDNVREQYLFDMFSEGLKTTDIYFEIVNSRKYSLIFDQIYYTYYLILEVNENHYYITRDLYLDKLIDIPYDVRGENVDSYVKNLVVSGENVSLDDINVAYNAETTESYSAYLIKNNFTAGYEKEDFLGVYDIRYGDNSFQVFYFQEYRVITDLQISYDEERVVIGKEGQKIKLNITPSDAYNENIKWSSGDTSVMTVDSNGVLTVKKEGKASICARYSHSGENSLSDCITLNAVDATTKYYYDMFDPVLALLPDMFEHTYSFHPDSEAKDGKAGKYLYLYFVDIIEGILNNNVPQSVEYEIIDSGNTMKVVLSATHEDGQVYSLTHNIDVSRIFSYNYPNYDEVVTNITNFANSFSGSYNLTDNFDLINVLVGEDECNNFITNYLKNNVSADYDYLLVDVSFDNTKKSINAAVFIGIDDTYFVVKNITFKGSYTLEVPYEIRDTEDLNNYLLGEYSKYEDFVADKFSFEYNEEATNSYKFTQEHLGIYTFNYFGNSYDFVINREEVKITKIDISYDSDIIVYENGPVKINLTINPERAIYEKITWKSSNTSIATVDENGVVTPLSVGHTNITACNGNICDSFYIQVTTKTRLYLNEVYKTLPDNLPKYYYYSNLDYSHGYVRYLEDHVNDENITVKYVKELNSKNFYIALSIDDEFGTYESMSKFYNYSSTRDGENTVYKFKTNYNTKYSLNNAFYVNDLSGYAINDIYSSLTEMLSSMNVEYHKLTVYNNGECIDDYDKKVCYINLVYYDDISIIGYQFEIEYSREVTVPYDNRTSEVAVNTAKGLISTKLGVDVSEIDLVYNEELTNFYTITKENFGIYDLIVGDKTIPITLYRVENKLTDVDIISDVNYIVLEQNNKLQLRYDFEPMSAIYEKLYWESSDPNIATIDENGLVTAHNYGVVTIKLKNSYISRSKTLYIYSEPEVVLNSIVKNYEDAVGYNYVYSENNYYFDLINDPYIEKKIMDYEIGLYLTDSRVTYEYELSNYSGGRIYVITFHIKNLDGSDYSIKSYDYFYLKTATPSEEDKSFVLDDSYVITLEYSIKYSLSDDISDVVNDTLLKIANKYGFVLDYEVSGSDFLEKVVVDLLYGNSNWNGGYFYKRKQVEFTRTNELEVPYNIRTEEELFKYIIDNNFLDENLVDFEYNEELTDEYEFNQENFGVYNISYDGNVIPLAIRRVENKLTNLEISDTYNKLILDLDERLINLKAIITPNDAIYEKYYWYSEDEGVAIVDENGIVRPISLGKTNIKVCDETKLVCDTFEIEVVDKTTIKLKEVLSDLYLYDDGSLYVRSNGYLELIDYDVKDIYMNNNYKYHIKNDNSLYYVSYGYKYSPEYVRYIAELIKVMDNVKWIDNDVVLTLDGELYYIDEDNVGEKIFDNVKSSIGSNMFLTNDDKLYVFGYNDYGEKFNDNNEIIVPIIFFENVLDYSDKYVLLKDGTLYTFSRYTVNAEVIDTDVVEVLDFTGYYSAYYDDEVSYAIRKINNLIVYGTIRINNKTFVVENNNIENVKEFGYHYRSYGPEYYYIDKFDDLYFDDGIKIASNVKEFFEAAFDYTNRFYLHYITNDNKLYRILDDYSSYFIIDNIDTYFDYELFITTNNDLWSWWGDIDYPSKITKVENPTNIRVEGIYIYEGTKKKISVGDTLDILGVILPYNATNSKIIWSVSDDSIASIDEFGILTALSVGEVTVYAKAEDGDFETSVVINVYPKVTGVKIYADVPEKIGNSNNVYGSYIFTIYANVEPGDAIDRTIVWTSSNEEIVTISSNSMCYAYVDGEEVIYDSCAYIYVHNGVGEVTIYARDGKGNYEDFIVVNVLQNIDTISFSEENIVINLSDINTYQLVPEYSPLDFDISNLEYTVDDEYFLSVDKDGLITANNTGWTRIRVSAFGEYLKTLYVEIIKKLEPIFDYIIGVIDSVKNLVSKISAGTNVSEFKDSIDNNEDVKIWSCDQGGCSEVTTGIIKTGYKMTYLNSEDETITYDISVFGDVSKDGKVNAVDLAVLLNHVSGSKKIEGAALESAYMNNDDKVNAVDLAHMLNKIAGKEGF